MDAATLLRFLIGLALLILGAELLVRGASRLARLLSVSPLVIGLTVVAFGTSAPELAVGLRSAWRGQVDIAVGNAVGSNIFNILFILGMAALIRPLGVHRKLVRWDVPVMIAVSVLPWVLGLDGRIDRLEGAALSAGMILYTFFLIVGAGRESVSQEGGSKSWPTVKRIVSPIALGIAGLWMIVRGADWLVDGAGAIARALGMSELVIGLTLVAAGTSLPEVATSIIAALRKESDLAVGNVVGSNIFNILAVLGGAAVVSSQGLTVSSDAMRFDLPVMLASAIACLPIFFTGFRVDRWEGALFVAYYAIYVGFLILGAVGSPVLPLAAGVMFGLIFPLTGATLVIAVLRARRRDPR